MPGCLSLLRAGAVAVVVQLAATTTALAHAVLLATEPADGAIVTQLPGEVVLRFNEPVAPIALRVLDPNGRPLEGTTLEAEGPVLRARLPARLGAGSYLVSYRVVSADAHPIGGSFAFAIGAATANPAAVAADPTSEAAWRWLKIALRVVQDIALMLAAGGAFFRLIVLARSDRVPGLRRVIEVAAIAAMAAAVLSIGVQGGLLLTGPPDTLLDLATWTLGARAGVGWTTLLLVAGLAAVLAGTRRETRTSRAVAASGGLAACVSLALSGHSAAIGWPAQPALALHAVAAAYWVGALWPLDCVLRTRAPGDALAAVRRFSRVALPAVALLVAAGTILALTRIDDPWALVTTFYGRLLLAKLLAVGALLTLAIVNRTRYTPALAASRGAGGPALLRNIRREMWLAAGVLVATALLAHTPPPAATDAQDAHAHGTTDDGYRAAAFARGHLLLIALAPAQRGTNDLVLRVMRPDGQPLGPHEVTVTLSLPPAGIEPLERRADPLSDGTYGVTGVALPVAGEWHLDVNVLISDFEQLSFAATLPVR